ncbi:MAG: collagen-like protein [Candidatus Methylumidiphilus sp.]
MNKYFLTSLLLLALTPICNASDSYDENTKQLTMNSVIISGSAFKNVVLKLNDFNIISVGASQFVGADDIFDQTTNTLTILSVTTGGNIFSNVVLKLINFDVISMGTANAVGSQGPQGLKGDTGATGSAGPQGIQGIKGDTGALGPIGPQGLKGDTGAPGLKGNTGDPSLPGLTLNSLVADVQSNLAEGPSTTGTCSNNPNIPSATPCPPIQSQCPFGTPVKTAISCTVLPSSDIVTLKSISKQIYGTEITVTQPPKPNASIDTITGTLGCLAPVSSYSTQYGFTPWCFYKLGNGQYGVGSNASQSGMVSIYNGTSYIQVTQANFTNANNWQCFPITVQAQAQCVSIPAGVKSVLQHFGIQK